MINKDEFCFLYVSLFQEGGCDKYGPDPHCKAGPERDPVLLPEEEVQAPAVHSILSSR